ncbi:MAG: hypothetical protein WA102_04870, partial [Candidatus Methanoperedens sp.]
SPKTFTRSYSSLNAKSMNDAIQTKYSYYVLNISILSGFSKFSLIFLYVLSLFGKSSPAAQQPQSNAISNYNSPPQVCANCGGGGKCHRCYGGGFVGLMFNQRCPACHGTGRCPACGGRGY